MWIEEYKKNEVTVVNLCDTLWGSLVQFNLFGRAAGVGMNTFFRRCDFLTLVSWKRSCSVTALSVPCGFICLFPSLDRNMFNQLSPRRGCF